MKAIKKDFNYDEVFQEIQNRYLVSKDRQVLSEMYDLLEQYYFAKLCNYAKKRNLQFSEMYQEELIHDMATRTIEHYLLHDDFKILKLGGYAGFDFLKIISRDKDWDQKTLSLEGLKDDYQGNDCL